MSEKDKTVYYHLPGLFEFTELYKLFLPIYASHREYFYDWCDIGSIYGAPMDCLWGGGRVGFGEAKAKDVFELLNKFDISPRLTFSNSLIDSRHLDDEKCNRFCSIFEKSNAKPGIIISSDLLMNYIKEKYSRFYFVSSTTKVITDFEQLKSELDNLNFDFVVPDFRLNKEFDRLSGLNELQKLKTEFLCNECCDFDCTNRKKCYEAVSRMALGEDETICECKSSNASLGYSFARAMENPGFIGIEDIKNKYMPMGFRHFKIEGRSLGSAMVLEFLLYYMTKPQHQIKVRELIYLDASLDLF